MPGPTRVGVDRGVGVRVAAGVVRAVAVAVGSGSPAMFGRGVGVETPRDWPMLTTRGVAVAVLVGSSGPADAGGVIAPLTVGESKSPVVSCGAAIWVPSASASAGSTPNAGMITSR